MMASATAAMAAMNGCRLAVEINVHNKYMVFVVHHNLVIGYISGRSNTLKKLK